MSVWDRYANEASCFDVKAMAVARRACLRLILQVGPRPYSICRQFMQDVSGCNSQTARVYITRMLKAGHVQYVDTSEGRLLDVVNPAWAERFALSQGECEQRVLAGSDKTRVKKTGTQQRPVR